MSTNEPTGREPRLGGKRGILTVEAAVQKARELILAASMDLTVIGYADALSEAGQAHAKKIGMRLNFRDWDFSSMLYRVRDLDWPGTPYLSINDFAVCAGLVSQYNEFDPAHITEVFHRMIAALPDRRLKFRLARESSPAVYVQIENVFPQLEADELKRWAEELIADEADWQVFSYRFWWD